MKELVLVGGGHTHVQVLRAWALEPPAVDARLTVVLDRPHAVYSGMVPGFVAGVYSTAELTIDVVALAQHAGAHVILAPAVAVDPGLRRLELEGRPSIPYDALSLDVGSTVRGLDLPGARAHALATRPIGRFVAELDRRIAALTSRPGGPPPRVVVVGAGAAGVELAFCVQARLAPRGRDGPAVAVVDSSHGLLPGYPPSTVRRVRRAAVRRGLDTHLGAAVARVSADSLELAGGGSMPADLVLWATGAAPLPLLGRTGLPLDAQGFLRVEPTLQVEGTPEVFATGDCATISASPWIPKAGVYAVRQGPILVHNLRAFLGGTSLRRYRPQRGFLSLFNLGDGSAIGSKGPLSVEGRWVWRLKDRIDRRFVERFRVPPR